MEKTRKVRHCTIKTHLTRFYSTYKTTETATMIYWFDKYKHGNTSTSSRIRKNPPVGQMKRRKGKKLMLTGTVQ